MKITIDNKYINNEQQYYVARRVRKMLKEQFTENDLLDMFIQNVNSKYFFVIRFMNVRSKSER